MTTAIRAGLLACLLGACGGSAADLGGRAMGFDWTSAVGTFLDFEDFDDRDHTFVARFAPRYPAAGLQAVLGENGGGRFLVGLDFDVASQTPQLVVQVSDQEARYPAPLVANEWRHVAVVVEVDVTQLVYTTFLDGERLEPPLMVVPEGVAAPLGSLRLGERTATNPGPARQFYGLVDEVAVFTSALDAETVAEFALLDRPLDARDRELLAAITFEDNDGIPTVDIDPVGVASLIDIPDWRTPPNLDVLPLPQPNAIDMQLPFEAGVAFEVSRGYAEPGSLHVGPRAFAIDFVVADQPAGGLWPNGTADAPVLAAGPGRILLRDDRRPSGQTPPNVSEVQQGDTEFARYLHFGRGTAQGQVEQQIEAGFRLGSAGDVGAEVVGEPQIHLEVGTQPEGNDNGITHPVAFVNYEVRGPGGDWRRVERGVPQPGDVVRRPLPQE